MKYFFRIIRRRVRARRKVRRRWGLMGPRREYLTYRERARRIAHERLEYFNASYGFATGRIAIRNQKSRWGSASKKGNLNFHYKIAILPPHLADYIIVHELCHLGVFNHSREFWGLVARALPNHRELRAELKQAFHTRPLFAREAHV